MYSLPKFTSNVHSCVWRTTDCKWMWGWSFHPSKQSWPLSISLWLSGERARARRRRCFHGISDGAARNRTPPSLTGIQTTPRQIYPARQTCQQFAHTHDASSSSFSKTFQNKKGEDKIDMNFLKKKKSYHHNTTFCLPHSKIVKKSSRKEFLEFIGILIRTA